MFTPTFYASLLMTLAAIGPNSAHAQTPAPAAPATTATTATATLHQVSGFRSARFGMTEAEVRQVVERDFKDAAGDLQAVDNAVEQTRSLALPLPSLEPVGMPASVTYIFGAKTRQLIHVNVLWTSATDAGDAERNRIAAGGVQLADYFGKLAWKPQGTLSGVPFGANGVVVFAGVDPNNAMVEVRLSGVALSGKNGVTPPPPGPTQLRVAYAATISRPDVAPAVKKGDF